MRVIWGDCMAKMTQQEIKEFDELYEYVHTKILGYDKNQSLSNTMVLRLKGLSTNKFIENKNVKSTAHYSYSVILNTFKYCSNDIQRNIFGKHFIDENHKFNYILKIVESNLNTVYIRMKANEQSQNTMNTILDNVSSRSTDGQYNPNPKKRKNPLISDDMW